MKNISIFLFAVIFVFEGQCQNIEIKPNYAHLDTVLIENPIFLLISTKTKFNCFILSKDTFDKIKCFKVKRMLRQKKLFLTSPFPFPYIPIPSLPVKHEIYPFNTPDTIHVDVSKNIRYTKLSTMLFLQVKGVQVGDYNQRERGLHFKRIRLKKNKGLNLLFPLYPR